MKHVMHIALRYEKSHDEHVRRVLAKEVESPLVPVPGMVVMDDAFDRPLSPIEIAVNPSEGYYHVQFRDVVVGNEGEFASLDKRFAQHGWSELRAADSERLRPG